MRKHRPAWKSFTIAKDTGTDQGRNTGSDVNHISTREIQHAKRAKPTAAPHPVCDWRINKDDPEYCKDNDCAEFYSLSKATDDKSNGYDCESDLEQCERRFRYVA